MGTFKLASVLTEIVWTTVSGIHIRRLACGAMLVAEPVAGTPVLATCWQVPMGTARDPDSEYGYAAMYAELVFRGAGDLDSRAQSHAFEQIGAQRFSVASRYHLKVGATMLREEGKEGMSLLAAAIRAPALSSEAVHPARRLCLQAMRSIEDDPSLRAALMLREYHLPPPWNRHGYGNADVLAAVDASMLQRSWQARCVPEGSIISVAGAIEPDQVQAHLDSILETWEGTGDEPVAGDVPCRGYHHVDHDGAQVHLGIAWDAPGAGEETSTLQLLATTILSGSTSGRLFSEVRQKRSLCYSIHARYAASRDYGLVTLHAGTTPDRAQDTLDACMEQVHLLHEGVSGEELQRAVNGLKSRLVMHGESTPARASRIGIEYHRLGRVRSLEDISDEIDAVTPDELNAYLAGRNRGTMTVVSVGPVVLSMPPGTGAP